MEPIDLIEQLLEECGYTTSRMPPTPRSSKRWDRIRAFYCKYPQARLMFVVALRRGHKGDIWVSRSTRSKSDNYNIYDPKSLELLEASFKLMKENHDAIHSRPREAQ